MTQQELDQITKSDAYDEFEENIKIEVEAAMAEMDYDKIEREVMFRNFFRGVS